MSDYRIEMTVRNNRIFSYMRQMGYESVAALCRANSGLAQSAVGLLLNLKEPAVRSNGEWTETAKRLAAALCCECDDLWTDAQRTAALATNKRAVEIAEEDAAKIMYADTETLMLEMERNESIESALQSLRPRDEKVMRMRLGFAPYYREHTLEEIGAEMGVSRDRVRQIEARAFKDLRHPRISGKLKDFV